MKLKFWRLKPLSSHSIQITTPQPTQEEMMEYHTTWKHRCLFIQEQTRLLLAQTHPDTEPVSQTQWVPVLLSLQTCTQELQTLEQETARDSRPPLNTTTNTVDGKFCSFVTTVSSSTTFVISIILIFTAIIIFL